ncbi:MAG: HEAT repeat domain-containing protein, partial [Planctomycetota bacterium]|nr:HEAT repeat domain-containing protein [Planctomycetota bacterium]
MHLRHLLPWLVTTLLPAQVALADLPQLARSRAERARPGQEKALQPFWVDLALDYHENQQFLDPRIAQAAALGDSVVPLLLEKLQPSQGGVDARRLAGNCRRVLERLDPASFVEALVELVNGKNEIGRAEAIRLLGHANSPQSVRLLVDLIDRTTGEERRLVLRSLRQLKTPEAAIKVVGLLGSSDRTVREDVLNYLIAARAGAVAETVAEAASTEKDDKLLPYYVDYFAAAVHESDSGARALLALLGERLGWQDTLRLVQSLGTVAPRGHEPTCRRLLELLESGETSGLGVQAAVTLRALGDGRGVTKLKRTLDELLKKPQRKRDATLFEQRASLAFAIEDYADAVADYERILEFSDGMAMTRRAHIGLIRSEVRRRKWQNVTKAMKNSTFTVAEIEGLG